MMNPTFISIFGKIIKTILFKIIARFVVAIFESAYIPSCNHNDTNKTIKISKHIFDLKNSINNQLETRHDTPCIIG